MVYFAYMHLEVKLSTVMYFVAGIGILFTIPFAASVGANIWLASRVFLLMGVVVMILKR